jgi:hypothetical protein
MSFDQIDFHRIESQAQVISMLSEALQACRESERGEVAKKLLSSLFNCMQCDFTGLLQRVKLSKGEEAAFLTYLLYGIYHREIWLPAPKEWKWFLVVLLAECVSENRLVSILNHFSDTEKEELGRYCTLYLREGSWIVLQKFKMLPQKPAVKGTSAELISGFHHLVYVLATRGDHMHESPWLKTLLEGLSLFTNDLKISLKDCPIVIFDQATPKTLRENRIWISQLRKEYGAKIVHLSSRQTLNLAKKHQVEQWIQTKPGRTFGYGGSRNAAFFLAPLFSKNPESAILHLGEDDVALPLDQVFSDALFAYQHRDSYFCRPAPCIGRRTQEVNPLIDLESLLKDPSRLYSSTHWNSNPTLGGMKGMLTKPRFCLPLPFGNEESHALPEHVLIDESMQPIYHLAGTRFPKKLFPISPLDGALEYLKHYLPYSFQVAMSANLLNPSNNQGRCVFPWNDAAQRKNIHSQQELLAFASLPQTRQELQKRFWKNLQHVFQDPDNLFHQCVKNLANYDPSLQASLELKSYFAKQQGEAQLILALGKVLKSDSDCEQELKTIEKQLGFKANKFGLVRDFIHLIQCIQSFPVKPSG